MDSAGRVIAHVDHPERRTGTRRAVVTVLQGGTITVRITGKERTEASGEASVSAFDLGSGVAPGCVAAFKSLAAADANYAVGQDITHGRTRAASGAARDAFVRAADGYATAVRALTESGDRQLRGETELALAALNQFDLYDWVRVEDWGKAAAATLGSTDPYRHARAEALVAYAWIQEGQSESVRQGATLLGAARATLQRLSRFHLRRGERYDAALQMNYITVTYVYQGRNSECVTAAAAAIRAFEPLHDATRIGQAWQNRAVCLWGLGRLTEARDGLEHASRESGPQVTPVFAQQIATNTALLEFSLGDYDESLRIYDRSLKIAQDTQNELDAARCLHGIGINYRALGDAEDARRYLEQALSIRTAALDGRSRMDTLRALAVVDAMERRFAQAVDRDREALALAVDPLTTEMIRVQLASHTAADGHPEEGKALLDEVIANGRRGDPIVLAQALVQRAIILRGMGRADDAVIDLRHALMSFRALGGVNGEFATNFELAKTLRIAGRTGAALAAVEQALALGDAVRLQSVNPDFRTQLEAPLRAVYDLKIELLRAQYDAAVASGANRETAVLAARAFAAADLSRARTFADVAAERYSPELRRELAPELHQREAIYRQLAERRVTLDSLTDVSPVTNPRARHLLGDIAELRRQADTVNTAIAARATDSSAARAGHRRRGGALIPAGSALVSYWLGEQSSFAWVLSGGAIHWLRLEPPAQIAASADALRESLARFVDVSKEQRVADAARLSGLVIAPLEPWLAGARQWVIVPDGALDYVPFAALRLSGSRESYVVEQHDVALTPAAWMLNGARNAARPVGGRELLLVSDPVYDADDPRLAALSKTPAAPGSVAAAPLPRATHRRLAYAAREAAAIRAEFPSTQVDELTGLDATRERFLAVDLSRYRFIHVAAHGTADTRVPGLSALLLSSYDASGRAVEGAVRVSDLALQTFDADVAVFSACDTALGRQVASEGLVGIDSTVLARGARAVVGSLWQVSDEIGAALMTEFYRHLLRDSMSAPAALAAAMRSAVSREGAADPALWAAFQVSVVALGPGRPGRNDGLSNPTTSAKGGTL